MPDSRYDAFRLSLGVGGGGDGRSASTITSESLNDLPTSFASCSIGCKDEHTLPKRINAISAAGFRGMELSMPDLVSFANQRQASAGSGRNKGEEITSYHYDDLCEAAHEVKAMCDSHGLQIMLLQPFANFEGWPSDSPERADAFHRAHGWIRIMEACGCSTLQVGSSDSPSEQIGRDRRRFVDDLRELADLLSQKGFQIAYENWCWSTHAADWEDVWDICSRVGRDNFLLCLDTFQSAGGEWGDPTTASGLNESHGSREKTEKAWKKSCDRLADIVPAEKIYVLQISDAYKPKQPFSSESIDGLRPRGRWSHDFRPLPFEGYLPVVDFTKAVLRTGFRGWFSYEIFDGGPEGKGNDYELDAYARRAMECQHKLVEACVD